VWYDFGTNEGGSIIDLVMKMENCSFLEAVNKLEVQPKSQLSQQLTVAMNKRNGGNSFSFHGDSPFIMIQNIVPITHPKLIAWLRERKIDLNLANLYCREIHYRNRDKDYFSIGFRNDNNGYKLGSPPDSKGCISPKDITSIRNNRDTCLVFEGFWDFLSYLTIQKTEKSKHDIAVLNSVANVQKAINFLKAHREIYTCLDNDDAGRIATQTIKSVCPSVHDRSERYTGFKDLNDFLCQKPMVKPEVKKKRLGIRR
ncbi:MAG: toprim domain-containing protein, partial [Prevotellaceae bacterium]|nr:toprim domain-containing protein [Prevotellaceae bacterium]